jgi:PhnB protein
MASHLSPYLSFRDNARQAMEFYAEVFGGELNVTTFAEFGQEGPDAGRVMHAQLDAPNGFHLMGSDTPDGMEYQPPAGITVSLFGDDVEALHGYWTKLSESGTVTMPLDKQAWGAEFGMCIDKFGVPWMVNISQPQG